MFRTAVIQCRVRNITVTVDDEVYKRARVKAAENLTSVSAVVKQFLEEYAERESERDRLVRLEKDALEEISRRASRFDASKRLDRWKANDR
jgi:hypothetical protein